MVSFEDWNIESIFGISLDLNGVNWAKHYFFWFDCHINREVVDLHMFFGDMKYSFRMYVIQKFTLSLHTYINCIYQVAIFDCHDLIIQIHENDLFSIVLDA